MNLNESVSSSDAPAEEVEQNEEVDTEDTEQSENTVDEIGTPSDESETEDTGQEDDESGAEDDAGQTDGSDAPVSESGSGNSDLYSTEDLLSYLSEQDSLNAEYQVIVLEKLDAIEVQKHGCCGRMNGDRIIGRAFATKNSTKAS